MPKPSETVPIQLRYEGPDVDDGSMSIEDIVPVLEGFSSAYGKIAAEYGGGAQHRIRITGVSRGSATILLEVWDLLNKAAGPLTALSVLGGTSYGILKIVTGVIRAKRHVKGEPFKDAITANNTISITNSSNLVIEMPVTIFQAFKSRVLDADIAKITKPLYPGRIEAAEIIADLPGEEGIRERIEADERRLFEVEEVAVTSTRETWFVVKLNSLTKSTESGHLHLTDGSRVFYRFVGQDSQVLHQIFGTYDGPVRVRAVAHMDESLKVIRLEVSEIEKAH